MNYIDSVVKGFIIIAIYVLLSNFSVSDMRDEAVKAHKRGIMSFGAYSRALTSK